MKNNQNGLVIQLLLLVVALFVIGAGLYVYNISKATAPVVVETDATPTVNPILAETNNPILTSTPRPTIITTPKPGISTIPKNIPNAHNAFGFDIFKSIKQSEGGKNIFISPSSIALALSMVYTGAGNSTKLAMEKTLHLQNLDMATINQESLGLINSLKNPDPKVELSVANSVWAKKGSSFNQNFIDTLKSYYNAESSVLDFTSPDAVKTINSWVSKNTANKITSIISSIPNDVVMYLINAVYFKGSWTNAFDKKLTENKAFTTSAGTVKTVPFMIKVASLPYVENSDFQSVNLTYGDNKRLSMYVFLPKDLNTFVSGMTSEKWNTWMTSYESRPGTLRFPKFKMEYAKEISSILSGLGMGVAFSDDADFTGIANDLKITSVLHKSYVDVNEEGTEAAAVTGVVVGTTSYTPPKEPFIMEVNRPFFFAIRDNQTSEILFMGVVQNP